MPATELDATELDASRLGAVLELLPASFAGPLRGNRLGLRDAGLVIVLDPDERHVRSALSRKRNADALEDALRQIYGPGIPWRIDSSAEGLDEYVSETPSVQVVRSHSPATRRPRPAGSQNATTGQETRSDQPPVDLYDQGTEPKDVPQTAEFDFAPPNGNSAGPNGSRTVNGTTNGRVNGNVTAEIENLPTVQLVQNLFRGKIRSVREEI